MDVALLQFAVDMAEDHADRTVFLALAQSGITPADFDQLQQRVAELDATIHLVPLWR